RAAARARPRAPGAAPPRGRARPRGASPRADRGAAATPAVLPSPARRRPARERPARPGGASVSARAPDAARLSTGGAAARAARRARGAGDHQPPDLTLVPPADSGGFEPVGALPLRGGRGGSALRGAF